MKDFIDNYYQKGKPVVLENFSENWLCLNKWNYNYFRSNYGDVKVKYHTLIKNNKVGKSFPPYAGEMSFGDFIDILEKNEYSDKRLFLYNLMNHKTELRNDFKISNKWIKGRFLPKPWLFFGSRGSTVRLHYDVDYCPNFLTQIEGEKTIWMFGPDDTKYLYKFPFSVHSPLDVRNPDIKKYPLFKKASPIKFVINKGQTLFIPPGWWHFIEYTSSGYSISTKAFPYKIKHWMGGIFNLTFIYGVDYLFYLFFPNAWSNYKHSFLTRM